MPRVFLPFLIGSVLAAGCGGNSNGNGDGGSGGSGGDGGSGGQTPTQVTSPTSDFEKLTYTSGGGWTPVVSIADECAPGLAISVDSSGNYIFDGCRYNDQFLYQQVTVERQLSDAELHRVTDTLAKVEIGSSGTCGMDGGVQTLTVETSDGTTEKYLDDFYSCNPAPKGQTYVKNMDSIGDALVELTPDLPLVVLPFDELKLLSSGGMPMPNQDAACRAYTSTLTLDVESSTLTWELCDSTIVQGNRVLSQSELEDVATKLHTTTKTFATACVEDIPTTTVTITRATEALTFADAETGCNSTAGTGETFAENLGELAGLLRSFVDASD